MTENSVTQLPPETVKLITSTQIVTSVSTTVKELLENSIDAGALIIQIRLENYGLDLIEVKDNGWGVTYDSVQKMFLPGYTSKIKHFEDLDKLYSYGFRGEALAAICKVGKVSITTKTNSDALAMTYDIDPSGLPTSSKPSHLTTGTVITVTNLFSNLPVRRHYLSAKKKLTEELKKTEQTVQSLSVIHPELNVSLIHNKCVVWKKNSVKGLKQSFMQAVTLRTVSKMDQISKTVNEIHLDMIVPKKLNTVDDIFSNSTSSIFLYVNKRPIICKYLAQPVQEHIFHHYSHLKPPFKQAICLISIEVPPECVDVNIEPNKTKVLLRNDKNLIKVMDNVLRTYYGHEDFRCTAVRETNVEEECSEKVDETVSTVCDSDEEKDVRQSKKPRLEEKEAKKSDEPATIDKFIKRKNDNWTVEIVNDETPDHKQDEQIHSSQTHADSTNLCSQINKENCVLTTPDEVSELNAVLNEKHHSVISTNPKNTITRLVERDELQCQASTEKKILPDWPVRRIAATTAPSTDTHNSSGSTDNQGVDPTFHISSEEIHKTVEEIVAEIESDVAEWTASIQVPHEGKDNSTPENVHNDLGDVANFNLSMESVTSQMGKKEMKAFTKFARVMRPKIVAEFPKLAFTRVAALLAQRWKALTPSEVKYYEQMPETVDLQRLNHREEKESVAPQAKNLARKSSEKNLNSLLEEIKRKSKVNRPPRREITLVTSLTQIKKSVESCKVRASDKSTQDSGLYRILGRLQRTTWLYVSDKEIGHVNQNCLGEVLTYAKLLSNHEVEKKPLDTAIEVNELSMGPVLWTVLISLDVEPCIEPHRFLIVSSVVDKNGFRVEMVKTNDVYTCGYITEVAANIPQFGVSDLKTALQLYLNNGVMAGLEKWRPTSVQNYLMNTAVRQHRTDTELDESGMNQLMDAYNQSLRHLTPVCLRRRPLFNVIHHIQD